VVCRADTSVAALSTTRTSTALFPLGRCCATETGQTRGSEYTSVCSADTGSNGKDVVHGPVRTLSVRKATISSMQEWIDSTALIYGEQQPSSCCGALAGSSAGNIGHAPGPSLGRRGSTTRQPKDRDDQRRSSGTLGAGTRTRCQTRQTTYALLIWARVGRFSGRDRLSSTAASDGAQRRQRTTRLTVGIRAPLLRCSQSCSLRAHPRHAQTTICPDASAASPIHRATLLCRLRIIRTMDAIGIQLSDHFG